MAASAEGGGPAESVPLSNAQLIRIGANER
jgi:hypothetical protein